MSFKFSLILLSLGAASLANASALVRLDSEVEAPGLYAILQDAGVPTQKTERTESLRVNQIACRQNLPQFDDVPAVSTFSCSVALSAAVGGKRLSLSALNSAKLYRALVAAGLGEYMSIGFKDVYASEIEVSRDEVAGFSGFIKY